MIIGNGLIANSFLDISRNDVLIFASGVSDSKENRTPQFNREKNLLLTTISENKDKKFIYFSTCDFYDSKKSSKYINHKFESETLIKENCENWIIFRVSQIIGRGNVNNLLFNFFLNIQNEKIINLYSSFERNLIGITDVKFIVMKYIDICNNEIVNIANPKNIKVKEIVQIIEKNLNKKSITKEMPDVNFFRIPLREDYPIEIFKDDYYDINIKKFIENITY
jgi:nucleoside-diphosphate-sugar epimerase